MTTARLTTLLVCVFALCDVAPDPIGPKFIGAAATIALACFIFVWYTVIRAARS